MNQTRLIKTIAAIVAVSAGSAQADLLYTFNAGVEGFQNVAWNAGPGGWAGAPTVKQTHASGGWQMMLTKEFDFLPGGGSGNQQLEMQTLANLGGRLAFDVMIDGASFPAAAQTWFQFNVVGNSDGANGWTQHGDIFTPASWHNADDPTLVTLHIDQPFSYFGWEAGDNWFQFWTGSNSDGGVPVNFYIDNVHAYSVAVPEPSTLSLAGLGVAALLMRRRN